MGSSGTPVLYIGCMVPKVKPNTKAPGTLWTEGRLGPCTDLDILEM